MLRCRGHRASRPVRRVADRVAGLRADTGLHPTRSHDMSQSTLHKLKEEFLKMVPPTVFFFIALHIVALVRSLTTQGSGLQPASTGQILLASLILGKAVLLA